MKKSVFALLISGLLTLPGYAEFSLLKARPMVGYSTMKVLLWLLKTKSNEVDLNNRFGIYYRYIDTRSTEKMQPALASMHHNAIWDDRDYGPNDADSSLGNKETTTESFKLFWENPNYDMTGKWSIPGTFFWSDVRFFLLDDRYFRAPEYKYNCSQRGMPGKHQFEWLIEALRFSRAGFKSVAIGGQVFGTAREGENYANYAKERQNLKEAIINSKARGVIFRDGSRHYTELNVLDECRYYSWYDRTVSSLTVGEYDPKDEKNELAIPETRVIERNCRLLEVSGPITNRMLTINIKNKDRRLRWKKEINAADLT